MKKLLILCLSLFLLAGCSPKTPVGPNEPSNPGAPVPTESTERDDAWITDDMKADLSEYVRFKSETVNIYETNVKDLLTYLDEGKDFLVMVGRPSCFYCQLLMPVLNDFAQEKDIKVLYVNFETIEDEDSFNELIKRSEEFLLKDEEGIVEVVVPMMLSAKEGKVVGASLGVDLGKDSKIDNIETELTENETNSAKLGIQSIYDLIY